MTDEQLHKTAYHEAGHVVFTYSFFYSCESVRVLPSGDGLTISNYGDDLLPIAAITNFVSDNLLFADLDAVTKRRCAYLAVPASIMLLAGAIAQAIHENNMVGDSSLSVSVSGADLQRVMEIDTFLKNQFPDKHPKSFIQTISTHTMSLANEDQQYRKAIELIAQQIINSPEHILTQTQIEKTLNECGFIEYLKQDLN